METFRIISFPGKLDGIFPSTKCSLVGLVSCVTSWKTIMSRDLIIPIYIDTNSLLDLLASIEGGFSVVEKITTQNTNTKGTNLEGKVDGSTDFGIPNVLSLLKLNLGLSGTHNRSTEITQGREAEK